jgi:hypothetical protein
MSCIPGHTPADASDGVTRQAPRERKSLEIGILKLSGRHQPTAAAPIAAAPVKRYIWYRLLITYHYVFEYTYIKAHAITPRGRRIYIYACVFMRTIFLHICSDVIVVICTICLSDDQTCLLTSTTDPAEFCADSKRANTRDDFAINPDFQGMMTSWWTCAKLKQSHSNCIAFDKLSDDACFRFAPAAYRTLKTLKHENPLSDSLYGGCESLV